MENRVYIVDAFTSTMFGGNPAGVVVTEDFPDEKLMQQIAAELNLSETVFVSVDKHQPKTFQTRFFTPVTEVELCGHATLAAFYVLVKEGFIAEDKPRFHVKQQTATEELRVDIIQQEEDIEIIMEQTSPRLIEQKIDGERLSEILGLPREHIGIINPPGFTGILEPAIATTGLKDLMVPIKSLEKLKEITIKEEKLKEYSKELGVVGIHAFTLETLRENTAHCRNFAPLVGISEEAATGTASGALSYYLIKNKVIPLDNGEASLSFEQGDFMNRPSEIHCYIKKQQDAYRIKVAGKARIIIKGEIVLS
jgi:trans-2,3-dihydro-3-hydroxyanthranilate isomerase